MWLFSLFVTYLPSHLVQLVELQMKRSRVLKILYRIRIGWYALKMNSKTEETHKNQPEWACMFHRYDSALASSYVDDSFNGIIPFAYSSYEQISNNKKWMVAEDDVDNGTSLSVPTSLNLKNEISAIMLCLSRQCTYDSDHSHHHHHQENVSWPSFSCVAITFSASIGSTVRLLLNSIHLLIRV